MDENGTPAAEAASTALEVRDRGSVTQRARQDWDPASVELIRATVAADCNQAELAMYLELAARYRLDPFAKQIWAAKIGGRVAIIVSRDGLLAIANRHPDYLGYEADAVREKDHFRVARRAGTLEVEHAYEGGPEQRGKLVGAWCIVHREGRKPTYFFAPFGEYKGRNVWDSNPSAMIIKVAESMAHRKAFTISGIVGEDEVAHRVDATGAPATADYGDDPRIQARLRDLFDRLGYTERKRLVRLAPLRTDSDREALIADLEREAADRGLAPEAPPEPEPEPAEPEAIQGEVVADDGQLAFVTCGPCEGRGMLDDGEGCPRCEGAGEVPVPANA